MTERTLIIVKPDAIERELIGEILNRFENAGLEIVGLKMMKISKEDAEKFYAEHSGKFFFDRLTTSISSAPMVVGVLAGENAAACVRELMGETDPEKAAEGTIRKDFGLNMTENSIHGSDSSAAVAREIDFFFTEDEIYAPSDEYVS